MSYGEILQVFFSVAHDPTQLNRQGPDAGTQYRSAIFYADDTQKKIAQAYIAQLQRAARSIKPSSRAWIRCKVFILQRIITRTTC